MASVTLQFLLRIARTTMNCIVLRKLLLCTLTVSLLCTRAHAVPDKGALETVPAVDLERYLGLWYEIARLPAWFQRKCESDTTATYTRTGQGIEVLNRCRTARGFDEARGIARIVDTQSNAKLEVSFFSLLGWRPVWGDYWVIQLAGDYSWAVVGEPSRRYAWVLSREPQLPAGTLTAIMARLQQQGYDTRELLLTGHAGATP
jgi:apolipoprotein D and lipocalin family protein